MRSPFCTNSFDARSLTLFLLFLLIFVVLELNSLVGLEEEFLGKRVRRVGQESIDMGIRRRIG